MKKTIVLLMIIALIGILCACGMNRKPEETNPATQNPTTTAENPTYVSPTIMDPTLETNIPDPSVDTHMNEFTEGTGK